MFDAAVDERLLDRLVRVHELGVLAHDGDADLAAGGPLDAFHDTPPPLEIGGGGLEFEPLQHHLVQTLTVQLQGHLVDGFLVVGFHHGVRMHVGEERDLAANALIQRALGAAHHDIRRNADLHELAHRVLGRFGLQLAGRRQEGHQGEVDHRDVRASHLQAELPDGLQEGQALDVADGPSDLGDDDVVLGRQAADGVLDLVGDMRDDLHGRAQVVAPALLVDHGLVDAARGDVVGLRQRLVDEALVVAQVQVGFGAVVGHEHLPVLEGGQGARIDVDVGVEFLDGHPEPAGLQDVSEGRRGDALPQR